MLADIICGPILRRLTEQRLTLWWVSPRACRGRFQCYIDDEIVLDTVLNHHNTSQFSIGKHAVVHLLDLDISLPCAQLIEYDLLLETPSGRTCLHQMLPHLMFEYKTRPSFIIQPHISHILHGSCRNPHTSCDDGLLAGEKLIEETLLDSRTRPSLLIMSGDQIYADDVAAITLHAIHQVIDLLGLNSECFTGSDIQNSDQLYQLSSPFYQRRKILPKTAIGAPWYNKKALQDIFTSTASHNHLISFGEVMAMYLLIWSPTLWHQISLDNIAIPNDFKKKHHCERQAIKTFVAGLDKVQRLLAHIPTYMIFDDHDVTDDWNLTALWQQAAYDNPLAKRIIGNMLMGYWLCQGWGNQPQQFSSAFLEQAFNYSKCPQPKQHHEFINTLLAFEQWQFTINTSPKIVVLDSRTRRWHSEVNPANPSGLMDWESMCQLQQDIMGESAVIIVSAAPVFGVKLIETIQRIATKCGHSLSVDAENWMAHNGSANTMLNIFKHPKTPENFVILSGDVHYSFVYDIQLRFRQQSPRIWQITSSGIKNSFPEPWISYIDRINRWLYGSFSPLNLFTKRRLMKIKSRRVSDHTHRCLSAKSGLGYLTLNDDGSPNFIGDLHNDGSHTQFVEPPE